MVVATEDNYPPFEFVQDGQPAGLDHDLYKLLKGVGRVSGPPGDPALAGPARRGRERPVRCGALGGHDRDQRAQQLYFLDADCRSDALLHEAQGRRPASSRSRTSPDSRRVRSRALDPPADAGGRRAPAEDGWEARKVSLYAS